MTADPARSVAASSAATADRIVTGYRTRSLAWPAVPTTAHASPSIRQNTALHSNARVDGVWPQWDSDAAGNSPVLVSNLTYDSCRGATSQCLRRSVGTMYRILVIGASAGGLDPLRKIVAGLPAQCPMAVFVVVHIGGGPSKLPDLLNRDSKLAASFAQHDAFNPRGPYLHRAARPSYAPGYGTYPTEPRIQSPRNTTGSRSVVSICCCGLWRWGHRRGAEWCRWRWGRWIAGDRGTRRPCYGATTRRCPVSIHAACGHCRGSPRRLPVGRRSCPPTCAGMLRDITELLRAKWLLLRLSNGRACSWFLARARTMCCGDWALQVKDVALQNAALLIHSMRVRSAHQGLIG